MASKTLINVLKQADASAAMGELCAIDDVHKEAVRIYIETWVRQPLQDAIAHLEGEKSAKQIEHWIRRSRR